MNNIENNKLIAEFMDLELEETLLKKMVYARHELNNPKKINDCQTNFYEPHELLYHFSWSWLMEVIETIKDNSLGEEHLIDIIDDSLTDISIRGTYDAVIEFIKWYNENK